MQLPVLSSEGNLAIYLQEIKKFPILTAEEEYMLAKRYKEHGDTEAAHKLVTSHLRLVAKIAMGYRGYGLPVTDLISEGNVGIMQAVKKLIQREVLDLLLMQCGGLELKFKNMFCIVGH